MDTKRNKTFNFSMFMVISIIVMAMHLTNTNTAVAQTYQTNGNAVSYAGSMVKMSSFSAGGQASSAWSTTKIDLTQPFDETFEMFFGCESGPNGGDGMTFTFQNQGINALGTGGGNLGLNTISPAISIEFDTYDGSGFGGANEIPADHIALDLNGVVNGATIFTGPGGPVSVQAISGGRDLESCASMANDLLTIRIVWDPSTTTLQLYEDGVLTLTYVSDIINTIFSGNSSVYWGFTGATGTASNEQWIAPAGSIIPWTCSVSTSCCTTFTPIPTPASPIICNTPIVLGLSSPYSSYDWSSGGTSATESVSAPGTYTVNVTENQLGVTCPGTASIVVGTTGPTADISGNATICNDGSTSPLSVDLTGTAPWSIVYAIDGVDQPAITGINSSPYVFNGSAVHTYTLSSVSDNTSCNGYVSGSALVDGFGGLPITNDNTFQSPGSTTLTVNDDGGTYDWYDSPTAVTPFLSNSLSFTTPTLEDTTLYYVQNSALTATYNKSVALLNVAAGDGPAPNDVAFGLPTAVVYLDFTAISDFDFTSITAEVNSAAGGTGDITINITAPATTPFTTTLSGATLTAGFNSVVVPFSYSCVAGTTYRVSYSCAGAAQTVMHWQLVAASSYPLTTEPELSITPNGAPGTRYPGLFDWQITVGDPAAACGRSLVRAIPEVVVDPTTPSINFFIPNLVTSNGDDINDVFEITNIPGVFDVEIYNRWGDRIYAEKGYTNGWNPTNDTDGLYYYNVEDTASDKVYKGWVQVIH